MLDVISIGSATRDVFVYVPKENFNAHECVFYPGTKVEITGMDYYTGGGATNSSVAFARLGLKAGVLSALGDDENADKIISELRNEKVDTKNTSKFSGYKTAYSVILTGFARDRVILFYHGATEMMQKIKIDWSKISSKWLYVSSLHAMPKMLSEIAKHAKNSKTKIAFNPGKKELELGILEIRKILGKIEILILNSDEALKLTGSADIRRNLEKLLELANIVVITEGKYGAHVTDGKKIYSMVPYDVKIADVTGAGDAFGSTFTAAIIKGKGVDEALGWASANASSVVMYLGTKNILLSEPEIKKFIKKYEKPENKISVEKL